MKHNWFAVHAAIFALTSLCALALDTPALADGDAEAGQALYEKKCKVCHATEADKHMNGPSLAGIFGRQAGTTDFAGYTGLKGFDAVWDEESLDAFLTDPKKFVGAKTMVVKVKKEDERQNIIAYLKTLK